MLPAAPESVGTMRKRILIVDDHPMLRRGVAALIEAEPGLEVCAEAATFETAKEAIRDTQPDLVIVDIALEGRDGLALVKGMRAQHSEIPALVLSMHDEAVYGERALKAGARGYVSKQQLDDTVLLAIRKVLAGGTYMTDALKMRIVTKFVGGGTLDAGSLPDALSDRELQVFRLVGEGHTTRQIANVLTLSVKTIESHLEHIKHKLTLESAAELAQRATQFVESE